MAIFTTNIIGPPPGTATTPASQWIDLGIIPTGYKIWLGSAKYTSPDKGITFELRHNNATKSAATTTDTTLKDTVSLTPKSKTVTRDFYKNGTLHTTTIVGTGVEKLWLRLTSKSSTAGSYLYTLSYTLE